MVKKEGSMKKMAEYEFTKLKLSPSEKAWLTELEKCDFKCVNPEIMKVKLAGKLEKGFDSKTINPMLLSSDGLTLLGLWYANPKSNYFDLSERVIISIRNIINSSNPKFVFNIKDISAILNLTKEEIAVVFKLCYDLGVFAGGSGWGDHFGMYGISIREEGGSLDKILYFNSIFDEIEDFYRKRLTAIKANNNLKKIPMEDKSINKDIWVVINGTYHINKKTFGKAINFIEDPVIRKIIFRDVEDAFIMKENGLNKGAIILSGAVIEEILRQYLIKNKKGVSGDNFESLIEKCTQNKYLGPALGQLSNAVRDFRNFVHVAKESKSSYKINKPLAENAVSSIFVLAQGLKK